MNVVDRTPLGYRRNDSDETPGRLLYRQIADAEARRDVAMSRRVRLAPAESTPTTDGKEG